LTQYELDKTKRSALIVTTTSSFLTPLALSTVNIALPSIGRFFSLDVMTLSWIATAYLLSAAIFLVPFGKIADIYGRKKIFVLGTAIFTASSFILGISNGPVILIIFRVFQGIGGAMIFGTGIAILSSVFPLGERGKVLGINVAAVYVGLSVGPFLGGILTQQIGWRSIFLFNCPLGIFIIILTLKRLKGDWSEGRKDSFDIIGSLIYSIMLLFLMYGFSKLPSVKGIWLIIIGIAGLSGFAWWETKVKHPIIDMSLFMTNRVFTLSNLAALLNYSATFAVGFLLSLYLQYIKKLSPQTAGLILVSQPFVQAILSPLAGRASDRIEPRIVASLGMAWTAIGLILLAFLTDTTGILYTVITLIIIGTGFALFASPNTNAIMSSVESRFYGVASSMLATMRILGQLFSMGVAMLIFAIYMGEFEASASQHIHLMRSIKTAFIIFGLLCIFGVYISLTRGDLRKR